MTKIPIKLVEEFVGEKYDHINVHNTFDNRYRVDCYRNVKQGYMTSRKIEKSYFVTYSDGVIIDKTIQPAEKL